MCSTSKFKLGGMRVAILVVLSTAAALGAAWLYRMHEPRGTWELTIQDLQHKPVASLTVRFTDKAARSCRGGSWKRLVVEHFSSTGEPRFPGNDPLSYQLVGRTLTIGRNEVCDAYFGLSGTLTAGRMEGSFYSFGEAGTTPLGYVVGTSE
jgi:hypothetical protein